MDTLSLRAALIDNYITPNDVSVKSLLSQFPVTPPGSMRALLSKMSLPLTMGQGGPFIPEDHAFHFNNKWAFTSHDIEELRKYLINAIEKVILSYIRDKIKAIHADIGEMTTSGLVSYTVGIPNQIINIIMAKITSYVFDLFNIDFGIASLGKYGRCGGMAFAGLDFYLAHWPVDKRFGKETPIDGALHDYIWIRLLDSFKLNLPDFISILADLYYWPAICKFANTAIGAGIGSIGSVVGAAIGAVVGSNVNIISCGGADKVFARTKSEWNKLIGILGKEPARPIGIIYGDTKIPWEQHQVLAIGFSDNSPARRKLRIWDNNDGNRYRDLYMDFSGTELNVTQIGQAGNQINSSHIIKAFFCEQYTPKTPPEILHLSQP